jgi:hypothetical protein
MTLIEKVRSLRPRIAAAVEALTGSDAASRKPDLNDLATKGAEVAAMMGTAGYAVTDTERKLQVELLQERFLTGEVADWQQFLELRGYVRGFRDAQQVEQQIVAKGILAETKLRELRGESV